MYLFSEKTQNNKGYCATDLEKTARRFGIIIEFFPMVKVESFFVEMKKGKYIAINDNLSSKVKRYKIAYELAKFLSDDKNNEAEIASITQNLLIKRNVLLRYYKFGYTIDKLSDVFLVPKGIISNMIKEASV